MKALASGRQRKVLKLFGVEFGPKLTHGAAGWEIGMLFSDPANLERWNKYLYLTGDLGDRSENLMAFDEKNLNAVVLPPSWNGADAEKRAAEEFVASVLRDASPYDNPEPDIVFQGSAFCFTGKFDFGQKKKCCEAVAALGGEPRAEVGADLDYLVVGQQGNPQWKKGSYGSKIERAVVLRRSNGWPAIVSEKHWAAACQE